MVWRFMVSMFMVSMFIVSMRVRWCVLRRGRCKRVYPVAVQREPFADFALKRPVWQAVPTAAKGGADHKISPPGVSIFPESVKQWWWIRPKMVRIDGSKVIGVIPPDARSVTVLPPKTVPKNRYLAVAPATKTAWLQKARVVFVNSIAGGQETAPRFFDRRQGGVS